ncbi:FecR family protein [Niabella ginsenosidivorans]|nr:FecR family protein [Niabella ginsenosidivorans]
MARNIYGEASPEEQEALHQFLSEHPQLQQRYELMKSLIHHINDTTHSKGAAGLSERAAALIAGRQASVRTAVPKSKTVVRNYLVYGTAIAALFLVYLGMRGERHQSPASAGSNQLRPALIVQNGNRRQLLLPDGSKVWLNGGSKLYYVTNFKGATREVRLEGEGFFDVNKISNKPFIVHAGAIDIKVLGTAFNVKAYPDENAVTTALYRGLISITKHDGAKGFQPILLYPNQKLVIPGNIISGDSVTAPSPLNAVKIEALDSTKPETERLETAWVYNRLEFRGEDFITLARKMEHWYNVSIHFRDEKVKHLSFYGSFEKETIEQAMHALQTANAFNYTIEKNDISISSIN